MPTAGVGIAPHTENRHQKRVLLFAYDGGSGVGHLRRLACIASQLQGEFACLIVTGQRAAAHWFVPDECEYIRLPSWDGLLQQKSRYWGREPFMTASKESAINLRKNIIGGIISGFRPDAIIVDHLPLGKEEELAEVIANEPCLKYLVTRGLLNETEDLGRLILGGQAHVYLREHYHRIFVGTDTKVFDFARQYNVSCEIRRKTIHTGYITKRISPESRLRARSERGLCADDLWVVASAGGGQLGEQLIESCIKLSALHANITFDIVIGPRSNLSWDSSLRQVVARQRLRVHQGIPDMSILNASADLVISGGGYNTLLEALQGRARILCFPLRKDPRDEQFQHALRLKRFINIEASMDLRDLPLLFNNAIDGIRQSREGDDRAQLDYNGVLRIHATVKADLAD